MSFNIREKDCQFWNAKRNFNWLELCSKNTFRVVEFSVVK